MKNYSEGSFKKRFNLEERKKESGRVLRKYPDRIPVIVEHSKKSDIPSLDKQKYLVPGDLTCGQFSYVIRKRVKLNPNKAMFIMFKDIIAPTSKDMRSLYNTYKDEDNFIYVTIAGENTFG